MPKFDYSRTFVFGFLLFEAVVGFEAGPNTTALWTFDSAYFQENGFINRVSGDALDPFFLNWARAPEFKASDGQSGVQVLDDAFGEIPYHLDLTAGNAQKIISYGAKIRLDTIRKDYSSFIAGFYETQRFMIDTGGGIHLGVQNVGDSRIPGQWLRSDSKRRGLVKVGQWHEVIFTIDARNPRRVVSYLFLDGKQIKNTHFAVHDDGIRSTNLSNFRVGRDPGNSGPPWFNSPFHGLIGEVIIERGYLIEPTRPHTDPICNRINLGTGYHSVQAGEEFWVPVFITNYSPLQVTQCQFVLGLKSQVAELVEVAPAGIAENWTLSWSQSTQDQYSISLSGSETPMHYGEGELLRLRIRVLADAQNGDYSELPLDRVRLDANRMTEITTTTGKFLVEEPAILYGDVTGNGKVDREDARKICQYVSGKLNLPDASVPNFNLEVADVSGDGRITSYDGALVFQYSVGIIAEFPVVKKQEVLTKTAFSSPSPEGDLILSPPTSIGNGIYEYRLSGENLEDFLAGEFLLAFDPQVVASFDSVLSELNVSEMVSTWAPEENLIAVAFTTNDRFQDFSSHLFSIRVHQSSSEAGVTLKSAFLNEGAITGNFTSNPVRDEGIAIWPQKIDKMNEIRMVSGALEIRNPGYGKVSVFLFDVFGREIHRQEYWGAGEPLHVQTKFFRQGLIGYRIYLHGVKVEGFLTHMR